MMTVKTVNSNDNEDLEESFLDISFTISLEPYVCNLFANILYFPYTISLYLCLLILFNGEHELYRRHVQMDGAYDILTNQLSIEK